MSVLVVAALGIALTVAFFVIVRLSVWKAQRPYTEDDVDEARQDSLERSRSTISGKVFENLAPLVPGFLFNPKDARWLGSPIDFVVFDGLDDGEIRSVVFVEVKTGRSQLVTRERHVRDAIEAKRVDWQELVLTLPGSDADLGIGEGGFRPRIRRARPTR